MRMVCIQTRKAGAASPLCVRARRQARVRGAAGVVEHAAARALEDTRRRLLRRHCLPPRHVHDGAHAEARRVERRQRRREQPALQPPVLRLHEMESRGCADLSERGVRL